MLAKIWKFLNAPIVILAIVALTILFVIQPRVFVPTIPHEFEPAGAHETSGTPPGTKNVSRYLSLSSGIGTQFGYFKGMQYASEVPIDDVFPSMTYSKGPGGSRRPAARRSVPARPLQPFEPG